MPSARVTDLLENVYEAFLFGVVNSKLNWIGAGERCSFTEGKFAGIVLLVLAGRSHAVIAKADGERRSFLSDLERAVTALGDIGNEIVRPRIRPEVGCRAQES